MPPSFMQSVSRSDQIKAAGLLSHRPITRTHRIRLPWSWILATIERTQRAWADATRRAADMDIDLIELHFALDISSVSFSRR